MEEIFLKKIILVLLSILLVCIGCTNENSRPKEIRAEIWHDALQASILIITAVERNQEFEKRDAKVVAGVIRNNKKLENLTDEEKLIIEELSDFNIDALTYKISSEGYFEQLEVIKGYFGNDALKEENQEIEFLLTYYEEQARYEVENDPLKLFMEKNQIKLTAKDVQYDMSNNLDQKFVIKGTIELDDYYNYAFSKFEKVAFSTYIIPENGKYSDGWYIYFDREVYSNLFDLLKEREVSIMIGAYIPTLNYSDNQGKMAIAHVADWTNY